MVSDNQRAHEAFYSHPPEQRVKPPKFPARPDLFDEVEWGPYVSTDDAKLAYRLWELPNAALGAEIPISPRFSAAGDYDGARNIRGMYALAHNVYEHLIEHHTRPPTKEESEQIWRDVTRGHESWTLRTIFEPLPELRALKGPVLIQGHDVLTSPFWTVAKLREELRNLGLSESGRSAELRRRLYDYERESRGYPLLPRSNLSHWGVDRAREDNFTFKLSESRVLKPLDMYTWAIILSPYNPTYWLSRAYCHYQQAYYDLAIGDAYRAMLLSGILADARERNRQPGLYPRVWNAIEQHILATSRDPQTRDSKLAIEVLRGPNGINSFMPTLRKALHNIISLSLVALGNWREYSFMEKNLQERLIMSHRDTSLFDRRQRVLADTSDDYQLHRSRERLFFYEMAAGNVDGATEYPYEAGDRDRTASVPVDILNRKLFNDFPNCEVRANPDDSSLYVVAREDIPKGSVIFAEEPSIRGHLAKKRRPDDRNRLRERKPRCENCRKFIKKAALKRYEDQADTVKNGGHPEACACALQVEEPMHFCSRRRGQGATCMEIARKLYHYRACGKDWTWLHDSMRPMVTKWGEFLHYPQMIKMQEGPAPRITHTNEVATTVLSLLLRDVFDMTLMRRDRGGDPDLMAHEIDELFMLEDHKSWDGSWFPFTFAGNIQVPFDILLQLGVDIFRDLTFDTWVIQTVMRKLMVNVVPWDKKWRGTTERIGKWNATTVSRQRRMVTDGDSFKPLDPSFETLYLFSGFSLFNNACQGRHNARWGYDEVIPNRVVVWAEENIPKSTEIRIPYKLRQMTGDYALRVLGKHCQCALCQASPLNQEWIVADFGSENDEDDEDESEDDVGGGPSGSGHHGNGHTGGSGSGNSNQPSSSSGRNVWGIGGNPDMRHDPRSPRSPYAVTSKILPGINSTGAPLIGEENGTYNKNNVEIDYDQSPNYSPHDSTDDDDEEFEPTPPINQSPTSPEYHPEHEDAPLPPDQLQWPSEIPPARIGGKVYHVSPGPNPTDAQPQPRPQSLAQAALGFLSPGQQQQQQQSKELHIRGAAKRKWEAEEE